MDKVTDDLRERVARAIDDQMEKRDWYGLGNQLADAVIPIIRIAALEEAAGVADAIGNEAETHADKMEDRTDKSGKLWRAQYRGGHEAAFEIATAIRARMGAAG